jgi:hypothetical protein
MGGCWHGWSVISAFSLPVSTKNRNRLESPPQSCMESDGVVTFDVTLKRHELNTRNLGHCFLIGVRAIGVARRGFGGRM